MTCVIVNDACCLIDLDKGGLLDVICALPYRLVVPLPVRESELLRISDSQWRQLDGAGLVTYDLAPDEVGLALDLKGRRPTLSANDCLCYVTAVVHSGILVLLLANGIWRPGRGRGMGYGRHLFRPILDYRAVCRGRPIHHAFSFR